MLCIWVVESSESAAHDLRHAHLVFCECLLTLCAPVECQGQRSGHMVGPDARVVLPPGCNYGHHDTCCLTFVLPAAVLPVLCRAGT